MPRNLLTLCFSACLSVLTIGTAAAQSLTSGDVAGTITDPSGAGVPNATVTLTNPNTNTSTEYDFQPGG